MEKPLNKIRRLENSIRQTKSQIKCMNNQRNRCLRNLQQIIERSVPKLKNIIENSFVQQNKIQNILQGTESRDQLGPLRQRRYTQNQSFNTVKLKNQLYQIKVKDSLELREFSKRNNQLVRQNKIKYLEENRKKKMLIKEEQKKRKQAIRAFHQSKKQFIKEVKNYEQQQAERHVSILENKFKNLQNQYTDTKRAKYIVTQHTSMFKKTFDSLNKMNKHKIYQVSSRLGFLSDNQKKKDAEIFLSELVSVNGISQANKQNQI